MEKNLQLILECTQSKHLFTPGFPRATSFWALSLIFVLEKLVSCSLLKTVSHKWIRRPNTRGYTILICREWHAMVLWFCVYVHVCTVCTHVWGTASQLSLQIPCPSLCSPGIGGGCHTHSAWHLVLSLTQQTLYLLSHRPAPCPITYYRSIVLMLSDYKELLTSNLCSGECEKC